MTIQIQNSNTKKSNKFENLLFRFDLSLALCHLNFIFFIVGFVQ